MTYTLTDKEVEHLKRLEVKNGGVLTADLVVADARRKSSPLHRRFEWDVEKAAKKYWLETARGIIASVKVVIIEENREIACPVYVRDPEARETNTQGYRSLPEIIKTDTEDRANCREVLTNEVRKAEGIIERTLGIADAAGLGKEARASLASLVALREKSEAPSKKSKPRRKRGK